MPPYLVLAYIHPYYSCKKGFKVKIYIYQNIKLNRMKKKKKLMQGITVAVVILFAIIFALNLIDHKTKKESNLEVSTGTLTLNAMVGEPVMFRVMIEKSDSSSVELTHELIGLDGNTIITLHENATRSKPTLIKIPEHLEPGEYKIKTTAKIGRTTDFSEFIFVINNATQKIVDDPCPTSCDDNNDCTKDSCSKFTGYKCRNEQITPCCGNNRCELSEDKNTCLNDCNTTTQYQKSQDEFKKLTIWEQVGAIKAIAKENITKAEEMCKNISMSRHQWQCFYNIAEVTNKTRYCEIIDDQNKKDKCFIKLADNTNNTALCRNVSTIDRKDNCYMQFVQAGDYSFCEQLNNSYYNESCFALRMMQDIPDYSNYEVTNTY